MYIILIILVLILIIVCSHFIHMLSNKEQFVDYNKQITSEKKCNTTPVYNFSKWTDDFYLQNSHNCYAYALDDVDNDRTNFCKKIYPITKTCVSLRPRPGTQAKYKIPFEERMTCKGLEASILADNKEIYKPKSKNEKCKDCYYKIAFAVEPQKTYHFYRQDSDGSWSHKDAGMKPTKLDASNNPVIDPELANRHYKHANYKSFCGYLCVPENHHRTTKIKAFRHI
jgi:hypothetical protein